MKKFFGRVVAVLAAVTLLAVAVAPEARGQAGVLTNIEYTMTLTNAGTVPLFGFVGVPIYANTNIAGMYGPVTYLRVVDAYIQLVPWATNNAPNGLVLTSQRYTNDNATAVIDRLKSTIATNGTEGGFIVTNASGIVLSAVDSGFGDGVSTNGWFHIIKSMADFSRYHVASISNGTYATQLKVIARAQLQPSP